ncbi:MAG: spermidine/putrescine ABC transporter substrate-binding protein [Oscillospiraceae bacterium]
MKKLICLIVASIAMCSLSSGAFALNSGYYKKLEGQKITLNVYNWGEYISDGSDDSLDVLKGFEDLTGITVHYTTFASNEEMYAKIKSGGAQYDILIPSDYMIARMVNEDMLETLDFANIPNLANIDDVYKHAQYDEGDRHSVPYMWGMVGLIYNKTMMDEAPDSWNALWDERFMGSILMFSNSRDAFGISLARLGYSLNETNPNHIAEAAAELKKQKLLVQAYVMDEIFNKMEGGEAAIAPYYAGDAITMMSENPDLGFAIPKEGTNYFVDAMVIPMGCQHKEAAEMFINYMCEPEVSAANSEYIGYSTPIAKSRELLDLTDEIRAIAYPDDEIMKNTEVFMALPDEANTLLDRYWTEILSYNENPNEWIVPVFLIAAFVSSIVILVVRARKKSREIY